MPIPLLIMVGADKGGVGKTTVARALIDFVRGAGVAARIFDTQYPGGDLVRFADGATIVDLTATAGQMEVFDQIGPVTIVDVCAGVLSKTVGILDRVKILDDAQAGRIKVVLLHVLGSSMASLGEIMDVRKTLPAGVTLLLVKNHVSRDQYAGWTGDRRFAEALADANVIDVPNLDEVAAGRVQLLGGSFAAFASNVLQSRMLRGYVKAWLDDVFAEFARVGLKEMMS